MTQFDTLLRRGLMDANLAQFESALQRADSMELEFSPQYLRERTRLLSDPWGWVRRRSRRGKRLDWRLVAVVAALLLLSACAYAVDTGQFAQWFPRLNVDPAVPEISESIMSRMGTVIEQTQTADGETVTLNAAVWDGAKMRLSLVVEVPELPEELTAESRLYTEECGLEMPEERWKEYVRKEEESHFMESGLPEDWLEESIQTDLNMGQSYYWRLFCGLGFVLLSREENTLTFEVMISLGDFLDQTELTFHLENIAIYEDSEEPVIWQAGVRSGPGPGVPVLKGPFDFTFTLEDPIRPIRYEADASITYEGVPLRFTQFTVSVFDIDANYEVLAPVNPIQVSRPDVEPEPPDPNKLDDGIVRDAVLRAVQGLWRSDGTYVDLSGSAGGLSLVTGKDGEESSGSVGRNYPHVVDPASVTAVNLGGTRVELSDLKILPE